MFSACILAQLLTIEEIVDAANFERHHHGFVHSETEKSFVCYIIGLSNAGPLN